MEIETRVSLWRKGNKIADQGDLIRVSLITEEMFIGEYKWSDCDSLIIERKGRFMRFNLKDIIDIC